MTELLSNRPAFGAPGIQPRWTRSDKDGVGTAYSSSSPVWWTVSAGILSEVYYPTIDQPQIRDLQFMITDGETFCHDERRHTKNSIKRLCGDSLGYQIINEDDEGRYRIEKQIISAPHSACVLVHTRFIPSKGWRGKLRLYALLAPHLDGGGWDNTAQLALVNGERILVASHRQRWLALGCTRAFSAASCGYVGVSDGWQDLMSNKLLDWQFNIAADGNVAMIAEIPLENTQEGTEEFVLGLAFSDHLHGATTSLSQSLAIPFQSQVAKFQEQWERACRTTVKLDEVSQDGGRLYRISHSLLLAHEDKRYPGAMIASLSIPWGEAKGDDDLGGYHLVWTRDMVNSALGLLASGNTETPFRALVYLACSQCPDGGFHQNFWVNGEPYWSGIQLDEVAFPILLAWKLHEAKSLREFDPWPMVRAAAGYLIRKGPATPQERWEENSGYSPSTLASNIAALVCAAKFAEDRGEANLARYLHEYADFLESHIEEWTVTTTGTLVEGIRRHFIRIHPIDLNESSPNEDPNSGKLFLKNRAPGLKAVFPAKEIVDAGFLELVRFGIRLPNDPLIEDSLKVVDATLKVETPIGPCWRRYNRDGYGQRADGGPFVGWGQGRAWPLLTGERAHYELTAGRDVKPLLRALESFANSTGLLPEQIWDTADDLELRMQFGRPTGSAMPLMWAHAEYIKLLRSINDGEVFDRIPAVADRYCKRRERIDFEVWKFNRQIQHMRRDRILRIQAQAAFRLRMSTDGWKTQSDRDSTDTGIGVHYIDIPTREYGDSPLQFTFFWVVARRWEKRDFSIELL
ncbi:glycoside hydrolase family 15 protein [Bythopirellula polymerisocia]|uniref:Glucoamylase n=1 Tax=Bythopirellula polymerisocia TaxID=2528003 RepID=A0A5C6CBV5_9BACT|nr:glycoside hydrolase family 15 protein [Bythopirellula polymerisocia]TWU20886.1 Glucoamylase precursor [Bythopirellula polymerisocia]